MCCSCSVPLSIFLFVSSRLETRPKTCVQVCVYQIDAKKLNDWTCAFASCRDVERGLRKFMCVWVSICECLQCLRVCSSVRVCLILFCLCSVMLWYCRVSLHAYPYICVCVCLFTCVRVVVPLCVCVAFVCVRVLSCVCVCHVFFSAFIKVWFRGQRTCESKLELVVSAVREFTEDIQVKESA